MSEVLSVVSVGAVADRKAYDATVRMESGVYCYTFTGPSSGVLPAPVIMSGVSMRGGVFVTDPQRFGGIFDEGWVRAFSA